MASATAFVSSGCGTLLQLSGVDLRVVETMKPGAQTRGVEVQEEAGRETGQFQVGHDLRFVHWVQPFHGFHFYDQTSVDQNVDLQIVADALLAVEHWYPPQQE